MVWTGCRITKSRGGSIKGQTKWTDSAQIPGAGLGARHQDSRAAIDPGTPDADGSGPPAGKLPETHIFVQPNIFFVVIGIMSGFNAPITHSEHHGQSNP